jgi:hypothetical protein
MGHVAGPGTGSAASNAVITALEQQDGPFGTPRDETVLTGGLAWELGQLAEPTGR